MRVLLVSPRFVSAEGDYYEFPLGLCYVSSCLKQAGFDVETLNLNHTWGSIESVVESTIYKKEIDVFCTGGLSTHFPALRELFSAAKKARRDVVTIGGGGCITSEPELSCRAMDMDIGVLGEGEVTSVELMRVLAEGGDLSGVSGLVRRTEDSCIARTASRAAIADLDSIPPPDFDAFGVERYLDNQKPSDNYYLHLFDKPRALPVISSRSCPYNCTFCYHPLGKHYRRRSLDNLFAEIESLAVRYNLNMITVLDEFFALDSDRLDEFCRRMEPQELKWIAQMRVDHVNKEILSKLKRSGLFYISYGLESASPKILESMKKHITVEQIETALEMTRQENIGIQGNLLFGDPAETEETANQTLDWWREHFQYAISLTFVVPYPGSKIYEDAVTYGRIPNKLAYLEQGCPPVDLTALSQDSIRRIHCRISREKCAHRIPGLECRAKIMSNSENGKPLYFYSAVCPHCGCRNEYKRFVVKGVTIEKTACRSCNQRYDFPTTIFEHVRKMCLPLKQTLEKYKASGQVITVAPSLFDPTFVELFSLLGIDPRDLNIRHVFDDRPERHGTLQLDCIPVTNRTPEEIEKIGPAEPIFLIPCRGYETYVRAFRDEHGIAEERLIHLQPAGEAP